MEISPAQVLMLSGQQKSPVLAECRACSHRWVVAYVPMLLNQFAQVLRRATCPMCGNSKRLFVHEPAPASPGPPGGLTTR